MSGRISHIKQLSLFNILNTKTDGLHIPPVFYCLIKLLYRFIIRDDALRR